MYGGVLAHCLKMGIYFISTIVNDETDVVGYVLHKDKIEFKFTHTTKHLIILL